jgi:drug/metabolite transporter (DMT)-like permease
MANSVLAALSVALAALLWGADSMLQFPGLPEAPAAALTFYEHLLGLAFLLPFVVRSSRPELSLLRPRHLVPLFFVGIAGETLAGIFFGDAYRRLGPGAAGFLQMLQPFCVLAIVWVLGRERTVSSYLQWAMSVLLGAFVIWVFDPSFDAQAIEGAPFWAGAGLGALAVALWAASNVAGKILLEALSPLSLVFLRWVFSLAGLGVILWLDSTPLSFAPFLSVAAFGSLLGHTALFALLPLWLFYRGLRVIPASLASFLELASPLALVFLPWAFGHREVHEAQWLGAISVVVGVVLLVRLELEFVRPRGAR